MDKKSQTELEAAAFRRLISHLQQHTEVATGLGVDPAHVDVPVRNLAASE